jgi:hypothetical protein
LPTQVHIEGPTKDRGAVLWRRVFAGVVLVMLAGVGVCRIVSTYHVLNQTTDEPASLAPGIEWIQKGTYEIDPIHPPLARVAVAVGPYLSGLRLTGQGNVWDQGTAIFLENNEYLHELSLARMGVLPFFLIATFLVWYWARSRYGEVPALLAALLFTTTPVVLGHAGQATTDIAITASLTGALLAGVYLLERATYARAAVFGMAVGLAILSKFSALVFLPPCGCALLAWWFLLERRKEENAPTTGRFFWVRGLSLAVLALSLTIWAGYRFSFDPLMDGPVRAHPALDHLVGQQGRLHDLAYRFSGAVRIPASAFFHGLAATREHAANGHKGYLLGQVREKGWWYFFFVALAVKTPIAFLVLIGLGSFYLVQSSWREKNWVTAAPVVAAAALVLVCVPSTINIGVRHLLPIYPLFAIIGGVGAWRLWHLAKPKLAGPVLVLLLLGWQLAASFQAHPDYFAYFNEFAGQHPEKILIDSDLDWGQDVFRLSSALREKHVEKFSIAYAGSADLDRFGLPPYRLLEPNQPTTGWVAISLLRLKTGGVNVPTDSFAWLEAYKPVCVVGRSILLYDVPEPAVGQTERIPDRQ